MASLQSGRIVVWALGASLVVSGALATKFGLDRHRLAMAYDEAHTMLVQLEQERTHLAQELTDARQTLESQSDDLANLQGELGKLQGRLSQTEQEITRLQTEQAGLRQGNLNLIDRLTTVMQEKQALESKLSSLHELRLVIYSVKQKLREERWQAWLARIESRRAEDQRRLAQGNRGYVIRNGSSTLRSMTKLQVRVLEPESK